jgi:hypothetical protein
VTRLQQAVERCHAFRQLTLQIQSVKVRHREVAESHACPRSRASLPLKPIISPEIILCLETENRADLQRSQGFKVFLIPQIRADKQVRKDTVTSHDIRPEYTRKHAPTP